MTNNTEVELKSSMGDLDDAAENLAAALSDMLKTEKVEEIEEKVEEKVEEEHLLFIFPIDGGTEEIVSGSTFIDFYEGDVTESDGSIHYITTKLTGTSFSTVQSLYIVATENITIQFNEGGKIDILKDKKFFISGIPIQTIKINHIETTAEIVILASTNPDFKVDWW